MIMAISIALLAIILFIAFFVHMADRDEPHVRARTIIMVATIAAVAMILLTPYTT